MKIGKSADRRRKTHDDHLGDDDARRHKRCGRGPLSVRKHFAKLGQHGRVRKVKEEGAKEEHQQDTVSKKSFYHGRSSGCLFAAGLAASSPRKIIVDVVALDSQHGEDCGDG